MSNLRDTVIAWADRYVSDILAAPRMWGTLEAVEMQVLQLAEIRALVLRPDQDAENPRRVLETYLAFLRERYPTQPSLPLFKLVEILDQSEIDFVDVLREFHATMQRAILPENPFEHSPLAIRLTFEEGRPPTASAFTGYYEEFRRATRAAAREGKAKGRATKTIEAQTDFALEDMAVTQPNGAPGRALFRLGMGNVQRDWEAEHRVRDGLSNLLAVSEWAGTQASLADLPVDDPEQRTRLALQARRLLPRRGIKTVAIGGRFVGRSKPVELLAGHETRFLEIVGAESTPIDFDQSDEIRGIDLDRGLIVLGKQRVQCFVRPEQLGDVTSVGGPARIRGQLYRPLAGKPFVLAESVEVELSSSED